MELVSPGIGLIFWMTLAFAILLLILGKFVWPPVMRALNDREVAIEQSLHQAEAARKEMENLQFTNEKLLKEAKEDEARERAAVEAERILESARERIQNEKMAAITDLKIQVANLSVEIAEKLLAQELSDKTKNEQYIEKSLNNINLN
jgi:F-type H+-transporting ATPase subunit b